MEPHQTQKAILLTEKAKPSKQVSETLLTEAVPLLEPNLFQPPDEEAILGHRQAPAPQPLLRRNRVSLLKRAATGLFETFPKRWNKWSSQGSQVPEKAASSEASKGPQKPLSPERPTRASEMTVRNRPKTLEICAGSGGLSHALWKRGFEATGVDWQGNRHAMRIPLLMKDLTDPTQQEEVLEELKATAYSHMAPPCGTASLARNQRVSKEDKAKGAPEPKPLRDANHPWGLPAA